MAVIMSKKLVFVSSKCLVTVTQSGAGGADAAKIILPDGGAISSATTIELKKGTVITLWVACEHTQRPAAITINGTTQNLTEVGSLTLDYTIVGDTSIDLVQNASATYGKSGTITVTGG